MLRVLYVIDTLEVGGSERSILDIASTCADITPFVCRLYPGDTLQPEFSKRGIPVHAFDIRAKYGWPTAIRRLRRLIRELSPDVVHTTLFRSDVAGRIAARAEGARLGAGRGEAPHHRRLRRVHRVDRVVVGRLVGGPLEREPDGTRDGSAAARHADEALHRIQPFLHKLSGSIHGIHKDGEHLHGFRPSRKRRRRGDVAEISPELKLGIGDVNLVCLVLVLLADDPQVRPGRPDPVHNSLLGI